MKYFCWALNLWFLVFSQVKNVFNIYLQLYSKALPWLCSESGQCSSLPWRHVCQDESSIFFCRIRNPNWQVCSKNYFLLIFFTRSFFKVWPSSTAPNVEVIPIMLLDKWWKSQESFSNRNWRWQLWNKRSNLIQFTLNMSKKLSRRVFFIWEKNQTLPSSQSPPLPTRNPIDLFLVRPIA